MKKNNIVWVKLIVLLLFCGPAISATQFTNIISTNVSTNALQAFSESGRAFSSGGIIMQGTTKFLFANIPELYEVSVEELSVSLDIDNNICIIHKKKCFVIEIDKRFAKPLVSWVLDGTETAFSNTEGRAEASRRMRLDGLVEGRLSSHFIAPQLNTRHLFYLFRDADYAMSSGLTESIPFELRKEIQSAFNKRISKKSRNTVVHKTWTNADYNTIYTTQLSLGYARTSGLPLRYHWIQYQGQSALWISNIEIFKNPADTNSKVLKDIVQLYQVAAILRTFLGANENQLRAMFAKMK